MDLNEPPAEPTLLSSRVGRIFFFVKTFYISNRIDSSCTKIWIHRFFSATALSIARSVPKCTHGYHLRTHLLYRTRESSSARPTHPLFPSVYSPPLRLLLFRRRPPRPAPWVSSNPPAGQLTGGLTPLVDWLTDQFRSIRSDCPRPPLAQCRSRVTSACRVGWGAREGDAGFGRRPRVSVDAMTRGSRGTLRVENLGKCTSPTPHPPFG